MIGFRYEEGRPSYAIEKMIELGMPDHPSVLLFMIVASIVYDSEKDAYLDIKDAYRWVREKDLLEGSWLIEDAFMKASSNDGVFIDLDKIERRGVAGILGTINCGLKPKIKRPTPPEPGRFYQ